MEKFLKNFTAGEIASEAGLTFRRASSPTYRMLLGVTEIVISDADAALIVANMDLSDVTSMNITGSYAFLAESMT